MIFPHWLSRLEAYKAQKPILANSATTHSTTESGAMTTIAYLLLFLGALAGGFVTGLAGFGTGLVALGIWLYVLPPSIAVSLVIICSIVAQTSALPSVWHAIDFKLVWPFLMAALRACRSVPC